MEARIVGSKCQTIPIHVTEQISAVVNRAAASFERKVLRTENQHIVAADFLDRRTFPHIAEVLKARNLQLTRKAPILSRRV